MLDKTPLLSPLSAVFRTPFFSLLIVSTRKVNCGHYIVLNCKKQPAKIVAEGTIFYLPVQLKGALRTYDQDTRILRQQNPFSV